MHILTRAFAGAVFPAFPAFLSAQETVTVKFHCDFDRINASAAAKIRKMAQELQIAQSHEPSAAVGYMAAVRSSVSNMYLGRQRARAVANELIAPGRAVDHCDRVAIGRGPLFGELIFCVA